MRPSFDRPVDRPLSPVDRDQPRAGSCQSVDRSGRPFLNHGQPGGPPGHICARRAHRLTGQSTGFCLGLLQAPFFLPLTSVSYTHLTLPTKRIV